MKKTSLLFVTIVTITLLFVSCTNRKSKSNYSDDYQMRVDCHICNGDGYTMTTCNTCDGDGYTMTTCGRCDGDGQIVSIVTSIKNRAATCSSCYGSGQMTCNRCYGRGYRSCSTCSGEGTLTCTICKGNRYINLNGHRACPNCKGTGVKKCYTCNGSRKEYCCDDGKVTCIDCLGGGKKGRQTSTSTYPVNKTCSTCDGEGEYSSTCYNCDGNGTEKRECNTCNGSGEITKQ